MISIKRIYEPAISSDGYRILVDRLWPRGINKDEAKIDYWFKEIAPSPDLRKWFNHKESKWEEFKIKYNLELEENARSLDRLQSIIHENQHVTLIFAAKDKLHNNAVVLQNYLLLKG